MRYLYYSLFIILFIYIDNCRAECNGGISLCNKRYNEITHLVTHDAYATSPNIAATQDDSIVDQLNNGVRGIKLSAVPSLANPEDIHLCHTFCGILDAGPATSTLNEIAGWLEANPKEIITIMWNNLYSLDIDKIAKAYESSNILPYVYTHETTTDWPTLQELIQLNRRVVNFIDAKADSKRVPWLMDQFVNVFETPYDNVDSNSFNCNVDRISPEMNAQDLMYVLNHFLYIVIDISGSFKIEVPYKEKAHITNSNTSLSNHIHNCTVIFKKPPTFVEVDFYLIGDALQVVSIMNGVEEPSSKVELSDTASLQSAKKKLESTIKHIVIENSASALDLTHILLLSFLLLVIY